MRGGPCCWLRASVSASSTWPGGRWATCSPSPRPIPVSSRARRTPGWRSGSCSPGRVTRCSPTAAARSCPCWRTPRRAGMTCCTRPATRPVTRHWARRRRTGRAPGTWPRRWRARGLEAGPVPQPINVFMDVRARPDGTLASSPGLLPPRRLPRVPRCPGVHHRPVQLPDGHRADQLRRHHPPRAADIRVARCALTPGPVPAPVLALAGGARARAGKPRCWRRTASPGPGAHPLLPPALGPGPVIASAPALRRRRSGR